MQGVVNFNCQIAWHTRKQSSFHFEGRFFLSLAGFPKSDYNAPEDVIWVHPNPQHHKIAHFVNLVSEAALKTIPFLEVQVANINFGS